MKPRLSSALGLAAVGTAVAVSLPSISEFIHWVVVPDSIPDGLIVEPWYYTGVFFSATLALLFSDLARQVFHGRVFRVRMVLECLVLALALKSRSSGSIPHETIAVILMIYLLAYIQAAGSEIGVLVRGEFRAYRSHFAMRDIRTLIPMLLAGGCVVAAHYYAFGLRIPESFARGYSGIISAHVGSKSEDGTYTVAKQIDAAFSDAHSRLSDACFIDALLSGLAVVFLFWAVIELRNRANQPLQGTPGSTPSSSTEPEVRRP